MGFTAGTQEEHRYQLCRDEDCDRFPCRIYREGRRDGEDTGYRRGWDDCYPVAFAEGLASCPGPHGGRLPAMTMFLILSAAAVLWVLSLLVHPFGKCPWCRGRRVRVKGRRARRCRLCRGLGRRQRLGSRTVHRIRRQVAAHWRGPR